MPLIDYKTGKVLKDKELKKRVQDATGWDDKTYQKKYDIFRNKAKNFERIRGEKLPYRTNELFYLQNTAKKRWGAEYRASELLRGIEASTSESTGKAISRGIREAQKKAESGEDVTGEVKPIESKTAKRRIFSALLSPFHGLLKKSPNTRAKAEELIRAENEREAFELVKMYANSRHKKSADGIRYQVGYD